MIYVVNSNGFPLAKIDPDTLPWEKGRINAIKALREQTSLGLKEAKDICDDLWPKYRADRLNAVVEALKLALNSLQITEAEFYTLREKLKYNYVNGLVV